MFSYDDKMFRGVLGELSRGKFSILKLPRWKLLFVKLSRGEFPCGIFPKRKLLRGKLPRICECIFYISFIKNEAWNCHLIKFSFGSFLKSFLLHRALSICSNCEPIGSFVNISYHLFLFCQIDAFKGELQRLLVLIKKVEFCRNISLFLL